MRRPSVDRRSHRRQYLLSKAGSSSATVSHESKAAELSSSSPDGTSTDTSQEDAACARALRAAVGPLPELEPSHMLLPLPLTSAGDHMNWNMQLDRDLSIDQSVVIGSGAFGIVYRGLLR